MFSNTTQPAKTPELKIFLTISFEEYQRIIARKTIPVDPQLTTRDVGKTFRLHFSTSSRYSDKTLYAIVGDRAFWV